MTPDAAVLAARLDEMNERLARAEDYIEAERQRWDGIAALGDRFITETMEAHMSSNERRRH